MCHLMASDKLEEQIPKLIPAILSLYKKNNEHYIISKVSVGCNLALNRLFYFFQLSCLFVKLNNIFRG
ncbi:Maestro heat-like repeat-containing protein family member 1 [Liparis tanakae]|uniref:Maestro heat-like repeat-containing protein family member 1 n=1 Tax=Liparis tanakae TaxID=230148 RepID=A0A4Z2DZY3_9TELE|nr:Maestro heat-like repeat-containing protein family member 1 [Liparis tanakae]